jgi:SAM-dependent methyltransferase
MVMPFLDQFSGHASAYAAFRPTYPIGLFDAVAAIARQRRLAVDVATGSGQAAAGLVAHFERVVGFDGGIGQIAAADRRGTVRYAAAVAECIPLSDRCADLITVAQALHWFDRPAFFREADRILGPRGVLAVWLYMLAEVDPPVDQVLREFYDGVVGPYWLAGRRMVDEGYRGIELPFTEVAMPSFASQARLHLDAYLGYVGTWSAVARCRRETSSDPLPAFRDELRRVWGPQDRVRAVRWPIRLRVAVKA